MQERKTQTEREKDRRQRKATRYLQNNHVETM